MVRPISCRFTLLFGYAKMSQLALSLRLDLAQVAADHRSASRLVRLYDLS